MDKGGSESPMWMRQRLKQWTILFEKYKKRGHSNPTDYCFSEVNYRMFAKPKLICKLSENSERKYNNKNVAQTKTQNNLNKTTCQMRALDINATDIIDGDADELYASDIAKVDLHKIYKQCKNVNLQYEEYSNNDILVEKSIEDLVDYIENYLHSSLRVFLANRSESKILETDDYMHWHESTKREMRRLEMYITKSELKEYMLYIYKKHDINLLQKIIVNEMGSNIKDLLIQREFARNNRGKYLKYCTEIDTEWQRLAVDISVDYIILYATHILACLNIGMTKLSASQTSDMEVLKCHNSSVDSGINTS